MVKPSTGHRPHQGHVQLDADFPLSAVARQADDQGFLITAYPTDAIKEGTPLWPK